MKIKIGEFEFSEVWDGVYYKRLSDYPRITEWELKNLVDFMTYEEQNGRTVTVECENAGIAQAVKMAGENREQYLTIKPPLKITECTSCRYRKGCMTQFVCHTAPIQNAKSIFGCGSLLSAVNARKLPDSVLAAEARNAAKDPFDYFHYIMFSWGNCQAGDRLVMERKKKRVPTQEDLSVNFTPGVRFYFRYEKLLKHPFVVQDGFLPLKVRDEVVLKDWVDAIVISMANKVELEPWIPRELQPCIIYLENDCKDIWDWSEKVYQVIEKTL